MCFVLAISRTDNAFLDSLLYINIVHLIAHCLEDSVSVQGTYLHHDISTFQKV
jgi:hypothetical protein